MYIFDLIYNLYWVLIEPSLLSIHDQRKYFLRVGNAVAMGVGVESGAVMVNMWGGNSWLWTTVVCVRWVWRDGTQIGGSCWTRGVAWVIEPNDVWYLVISVCDDYWICKTKFHLLYVDNVLEDSVGIVYCALSILNDNSLILRRWCGGLSSNPERGKTFLCCFSSATFLSVKYWQASGKQNNFPFIHLFLN